MSGADDFKLCIYCGHENPPQAVLCMQCAAYLPDDAAALPDDLFPAREWAARERALGIQVALFAPGEPQPLVIEMPDETRLVLGRGDQVSGPDVDLNVFGAGDKGVSRRHALLERRGPVLALSDLESRNGTYVNGQWAFPAVYYALEDGDIVRMGGLLLKVYFDSLPRAQTAERREG